MRHTRGAPLTAPLPSEASFRSRIRSSTDVVTRPVTSGVEVGSACPSSEGGADQLGKRNSDLVMPLAFFRSTYLSAAAPVDYRG